MKKLLFITTICLYSSTLLAQSPEDSIQLREVSIRTQRLTIERLPPVQGTYIWAGKKSEVISMDNTDANIAEKTARQIFSKIPGVFVYDMDGSGNQVNISTRGLDPHRGWEFNVRTDGIITNSDMYGYPASHLSIPMEAIGRIELVRGTGALQYGAQFGGMLNYVLRQPDTTRQIGLESINSVGSYGLLSTYNAVGGRIGRLDYQAYYSKRVSTGYRDNAESDFDGQGLMLRYHVNDRLSLRAEFLRSQYIYRLPGALTDAQFEANPRQSTRSRNFYSPEIYVPSFTLDWRIGNRTSLRWTASAVLGYRNSVMWDRPANVKDTINAASLAYNARQVDIDNFNSYTTELRILRHYDLLGNTSTLAVGVQYMHNDLNRRQLGTGTTGSDYDLSVDANGFRRDLWLRSRNVAFFLENKFQLTRSLSLSPGFRYESGHSKLSGKTTYYDPQELLNTIEHNFPLLGVNMEYQISENQTFYAGWSQAYRPVILKDIIPANIYEQVDKDLEDAFGYNLELGWRGSTRNFKWDISAFALQYNNRLGNLAEYDENRDTFVLYRTNIGDARTLGLELFAEYGFYLTDEVRVNIFSSTSWFNAEYLGDSLRASSRENRGIKGNRVESVPEWISRNGLNARYKELSVSLLYSYTAESYADPFNTKEPSANGAVGLVPAYGLLDLNATWRISPQLTLRLSASNLLDEQYFTKRPTFYPGPGIWPSDGRSFVATVAIRL